MPNTLINGAAINGNDEEGLVLFGLDLVSSGTAEMVQYLVAGGGVPVEPGAIALKFPLGLAAGLEMVSSGTHEGLFNAMIQPAGIELVTAGTAAISVTYLDAGYHPLELGNNRPQLGFDVVLQVNGMELVAGGVHDGAAAVTPAALVLEAEGYRPLSLGTPALSLGTIYVDAASATPMQMGTPGAITVGLLANSSWPLDMGAPKVSSYVDANGARPLELGLPSTLGFTVLAQGLDLARQGTHSTEVAAIEVTVGGAFVLELGKTGLPAIALHARQSFPLQLGQPLADRGNTC